MLTRRIIACLDVRDGVVVKGVQFQNHVALGDPVSLAKRYAEEGADEIVLYDIRASTVGMGVREELVSQLAATLDIPFCVAGGIDSVDKARRILNAGADKISVNTPALQRPGLIDELAAAFGSQCVVIGIDARPNDEGGWSIFSHTGDPSTMRHTGRDALLWIKEAVSRGAGEIVLNCMNRDGTKAGFDLEFLAAARAVCSVPLVASGGAGTAQHFVDVFSHAYVDAALAAGALHRGELTLSEIKSALARVGEPVRPVTAASPAVWRFAAEPEAASARSQRALPRRADLEPLDFAKMGGLLPVVVQNADSKEILMLAYASSESLDCSLEQGLACFFSRSRGELWTKGATSGNTLELLSVRKDCDGDALIFAVRPRGPSCHRGVESCFDQRP